MAGGSLVYSPSLTSPAVLAGGKGAAQARCRSRPTRDDPPADRELVRRRRRAADRRRDAGDRLAPGSTRDAQEDAAPAGGAPAVRDTALRAVRRIDSHRG